MSNNKMILGCLVALGAFFFLFGIIFGVAVRAKIHHSLKTANRVCGPDSDAFDKWATNTDEDDPPKFKLYYGFNAVNAAEYLEQTTTPVDLKLNVKGPYAMRQLDEYFDTKFSSDNRQVSYKTYSRYVFTEEASCEGCTSTETYTNINPMMLGLMTASGPEIAIGLTVSNFDVTYRTPCTPEGIQSALRGPICDPTTDATCCCNRTATDRYSCAARAANLYSTFASFDGGVKFTSPTLKAPVYTPLFISKNVHEFAYGYPSAFFGVIAAKKEPKSIPLLAQFTELMHMACGFSSEGITGTVEELAGKPWQFMALTTCKPILGTKFWTDIINPANNMTRCQAAGMALGVDACACADPKHGVNGVTDATRPCCTAVGLGCLYKVKGYVSDDLYLSQQQSAASYQLDGTTQNTGCGDFEGETGFWWSRYEKKEDHPAWAQFDRAAYVRPTQAQVALTLASDDNITFFSPVVGSDGTRMQGHGVTSSLTASSLSDLNKAPAQLTVYITQTYRATMVYKTGTEDFDGIKLIRYAPASHFLDKTSKALPGDRENFQVGAATPYDGLQDVTFLVDFPAFVSRPYFLYGDKYLMRQVPESCKTTPTPSLCSGILITVDGEEPVVTPELYDTYLLVDLATGMTMKGHKRLMASFSTYKDLGPSFLSPFVPTEKIIPQYWMDETSEATKDQRKKYKMVTRLNHSAGILVVVLPVLGGLLAVVASIALFRLHQKKGGSVIETSLMSDRD